MTDAFPNMKSKIILLIVLSFILIVTGGTLLFVEYKNKDTLNTEKLNRFIESRTPVADSEGEKQILKIAQISKEWADSGREVILAQTKLFKATGFLLLLIGCSQLVILVIILKKDNKRFQTDADKPRR